MNPITQKQLKSIVDRINRQTESPMETWATRPDGRFISNVGNYHLDWAYGRVSLHRMVNELGGVSDVFRCGHVSKRELANRMWAFLDGLEAAKQAKEVVA